MTVTIGAAKGGPLMSWSTAHKVNTQPWGACPGVFEHSLMQSEGILGIFMAYHSRSRDRRIIEGANTAAGSVVATQH